MYSIHFIKNKIADKILRHFLFLDFLHERQLIVDIQIVISIALEMHRKLKTSKHGYLNFYDRNHFPPQDKILRQFSIFFIYFRHKYEP